MHRQIRITAGFLAFASVCLLLSLAGIATEGRLSSVTLVRSAADFVVSWTTDGAVRSVKVFEGTSPDAINQRVDDVSDDAFVRVTGLDPAQRHYFRVKGGAGEGIVVSERGVPQMGVLNFRDIGGYHTDPNGGGQTQTVKWGLFFRSGAPSAQSNQGFLTTLNARTIIDVRAPNEVTASAPAWSAPGAVVISLPIFDQTVGGVPDPVTPRLCLPQNVSPSNPSHHYFPFDPVCFADQEAFFGPNGEFFSEFKSAAYRGMVSGHGPAGANFGPTVNIALRGLLLALTDRNNLPLVWADTGGAARVGWGAAVVLMALGASESEVMTDYLRTNDFRGPANNAQLNALVGSGLLGKRIYLEPQLFERPEYLEGQLEELHYLYGTFENYAFEALGITAEQLAAIRENLRKG